MLLTSVLLSVGFLGVTYGVTRLYEAWQTRRVLKAVEAIESKES